MRLYIEISEILSEKSFDSLLNEFCLETIYFVLVMMR